jgi:hypothetical protein
VEQVIHDVDTIERAATWEDTVATPAPGRLELRARDDLAGVTPAMFAWFFAHLDRERYLRFHPVDHDDFAWLRGKRPGTHVGATHLTVQRYGGAGPVMRAEITFAESPPLRDAAAVAICATARAADDGALIATFAHVALPRPFGTELRSAWWFDDPDDDAARERMTAGRLRHVHEEFDHLADFLPALHAAAAGATR